LKLDCGVNFCHFPSGLLQKILMFDIVDSEDSDRNEVRVSMGWKVKKDNKTGSSSWQITER
jgi:hypothetical protein